MMSPSFIQGSKKSFPLAAITFDKFHIMKAINHALDEVRRVENKTNKELNKTRWLWLKNLNALTPTQNTQLKELLQNPYLKTAKAYALKLNYKTFGIAAPKKQLWFCSTGLTGKEEQARATHACSGYDVETLGWYTAMVPISN